jgi:hypothetical protein
MKFKILSKMSIPFEKKYLRAKKQKIINYVNKKIFIMIHNFT